MSARCIVIISAFVIAPACHAALSQAESALKDRVEAIAAQAGLVPVAASPDDRQAIPGVPASKPVEPPSPAPLFLVNGDFEDIAPFDTGPISNRCTNLAPWANAGWGLNAGTFLRTDDLHALEGARLRVFHDANTNSQVAGIFAKESRGIRMGFARFVQGDAWGGTSCPSAVGSDGGRIGWGKPKPLAVSGRRLGLKIDVRNEEVWKFSNRARRGGVGGTSHVMMAFNVWLSSPRLAKRAVLDLAVVHDCNWGAGVCGPNTGEGANAYHYIVHLSRDDRDSPRGQWTRWIIDLSRHISRAADKFGWDKSVRESLSITQVEFLIEVMDGQGKVLFDNVHLLEIAEGVNVRDASMSLPAADGADPLPIAERPSR